MTSHTSKLFQIAVSALTIVPVALTLNLNSVRAQSTPNAIGELTDLTELVAHNPLSPAPVAKLPQANSDLDSSSLRDRSMAYVKSGYEAETAENTELALANYYTAAKIDPTNGYAFLLAGRLIGNNETGIECVTMAAQLFKAQNDSQGYQLASGLLSSVNAIN